MDSDVSRCPDPIHSASGGRETVTAEVGPFSALSRKSILVPVLYVAVPLCLCQVFHLILVLQPSWQAFTFQILCSAHIRRDLTREISRIRLRNFLFWGEQSFWSDDSRSQKYTRFGPFARAGPNQSRRPAIFLLNYRNTQR